MLLDNAIGYRIIQLKFDRAFMTGCYVSNHVHFNRQLLLDCGIGASSDSEAPVVNQHRVLLFCQLKSMLDIVEHDLLKYVHVTVCKIGYLCWDMDHQLNSAIVFMYWYDVCFEIIYNVYA